MWFQETPLCQHLSAIAFKYRVFWLHCCAPIFIHDMTSFFFFQSRNDPVSVKDVSILVPQGTY